LGTPRGGRKFGGHHPPRAGSDASRGLLHLGPCPFGKSYESRGEQAPQRGPSPWEMLGDFEGRSMAIRNLWCKLAKIFWMKCRSLAISHPYYIYMHPKYFLTRYESLKSPLSYFLRYGTAGSLGYTQSQKLYGFIHISSIWLHVVYRYIHHKTTIFTYMIYDIENISVDVHYIHIWGILYSYK